MPSFLTLPDRLDYDTHTSTWWSAQIAEAARLLGVEPDTEPVLPETHIVHVRYEQVTRTRKLGFRTLVETRTVIVSTRTQRSTEPGFTPKDHPMIAHVIIDEPLFPTEPSATTLPDAEAWRQTRLAVHQWVADMALADWDRIVRTSERAGAVAKINAQVRPNGPRATLHLGSNPDGTLRLLPSI